MSSLASAGVARLTLMQDPQGNGWQANVQQELRSSLVCCSAAAFALEGLAHTCRAAPGNQSSGSGSKAVIGLVNGCFPIDPKDRPLRKHLDQSVKDLFKLRSHTVHHKAEFIESARTHPVLGQFGATSGDVAHLTVEASQRACETLREIVILIAFVRSRESEIPTGTARNSARYVAECFGWTYPSAS